MASEAAHRRLGFGAGQHSSIRPTAGIPAGAEPTATLTIDGKHYVVTGELAVRLRATLRPYIEAARKLD